MTRDINLTDLNYVSYHDLTDDELADRLRSVNFHLIKACNYRCRFCFANFNQVLTNYLPETTCRTIISKLAGAGTQKITFVGGEPTMVPFLPELVRFAKSLGLITMIVTNGSKITPAYLAKMQDCLDWVGLSIDSGSEAVSKALGRGKGKHVSQTREVVNHLKAAGVRIKLNTVVTALTYNEDMSWLIREIQPERWKVFQMLPIEGENDDAWDLLITREQFNHFLATHAELDPVAESNDNMTDSYIMIDPQGCFFNNSAGKLSHGLPIHKVGVQKAFSHTNFSIKKFQQRGGEYQW